MTEHDTKDSWGCKLPDLKVTWLNENGDASAEAEEFREAQTAYPTVKHPLTKPTWALRKLILTYL